MSSSSGIDNAKSANSQNVASTESSLQTSNTIVQEAEEGILPPPAPEPELD